MDVNNPKVFNWYSRRAQFTRYGKALRSWVFLLELSAVLLLVFGLALMLIGFALGWALMGLAAIPAMVVHWYKGELNNVPIYPSVRSIDARADAELLAVFSKQPSPKELAYALMNIN